MHVVLFQHPDATLPRARDLSALQRQRQAGLAEWERLWLELRPPAADASREDRLFHERSAEIGAREREEIKARQALPLAEPLDRARPLAVVAHRHGWIATALAKGLRAAGWEVIDATGDVPSAVAALVVCQPDVLITSDRMMGGAALGLLDRAHLLAPETRLVVEVDADERAEQVKRAGAHVVVSRRMPTPQLVETIEGLRQAPGVVQHS